MLIYVIYIFKYVLFFNLFYIYQKIGFDIDTKVFIRQKYFYIVTKKLIYLFWMRKMQQKTIYFQKLKFEESLYFH